MQIQISKTVVEDVRLPYEQVEEITLKYLEGLLSPGSFLSRDGKRLMIEDEHYHGSVTDSDVGPASPMQQTAGAMIKFIKEQRKERQKRKERQS